MVEGFLMAKVGSMGTFYNIFGKPEIIRNAESLSSASFLKGSELVSKQEKCTESKVQTGFIDK